MSWNNKPNVDHTVTLGDGSELSITLIPAVLPELSEYNVEARVTASIDSPLQFSWRLWQVDGDWAVGSADPLTAAVNKVELDSQALHLLVLSVCALLEDVIPQKEQELFDARVVRARQDELLYSFRKETDSEEYRELVAFLDSNDPLKQDDVWAQFNKEV